jgi:hypothetical protein
LPHFQRYLKAMLVRAERAAVNPPKDLEKQRQVQPFVEALSQLRKLPRPGGALTAQIEEFRLALCTGIGDGLSGLTQAPGKAARDDSRSGETRFRLEGTWTVRGRRRSVETVILIQI